MTHQIPFFRLCLLLVLLGLVGLSSLRAQSEGLRYPLVKGHGGVFALPDPQLPQQAPRLIVDLTQRSSDADAVNPGLDRLARLINLYGLAGYPADSLDIAVIVHGAALPVVLSDAGCQRFLDQDNSSRELIMQLDALGVEFIVCGQALMHRGYGTDYLLPAVTLGLSAITTLVDYQQRGYAVLDF